MISLNTVFNSVYAGRHVHCMKLTSTSIARKHLYCRELGFFGNRIIKWRLHNSYSIHECIKQRMTSSGAHALLDTGYT